MRQQPFASPQEAFRQIYSKNLGSVPISIAEDSVLQQGEQFVEDLLVHFGVKGMRWGFRKDNTEAQNFGEPYSHALGLGHGSKIYDLKKPENLRVEQRDNIIDVRPKNGFRSKRAEEFHDEMLRGVGEMSKEYPALRDMKIEITPMSHQPGAGLMIWSGVPAAAAHLKEGEARLYYNDRMRGPAGKASSEALKIQPGIQHKNFLGRHEMGHVMAMAGGQMPSGWDATHSSDRHALDNEREQINQRHKDLFTKHKLSFGEVSKLSPYAATEPGEGLAELAAYYHTPALKKQMPLSTQIKAKALLDDIGGKKR
jgi:hypothetical protein